MLSGEGDEQDGEPLLVPVMREGRVIEPRATLEHARRRCAEDLARLPEPLRRLERAAAYPVAIAPALEELTKRVDEEMARAGEVARG